MSRAKDIAALIARSRKDLAELKVAYESSLHQQTISEELRVDIKNVFENLRSCLDYIAHDLFEKHCSGKPGRLYFPIRQTHVEFAEAMANDYPGLEQNCKAAYDFIETIQPYNDPWLGKFNRLNNENKHQQLAEQTRTETRRVTVSSTSGSVSWGPGVTFGHGVSVMGVPIDPRTQMPVPNNVVETKVVVWVDFLFSEISESAYPFVEDSIGRVEGIFRALERHC